MQETLGPTFALTPPPRRRFPWRWVAAGVACVGGAFAVAFGLYVLSLAGKISRGELDPSRLARPAGRVAGAATPAQALGVDRPTIGEPDAPVVVVEFLDFQCPFCKLAEPVVNQVLRSPAYAGKVRFVFRHFPLLDIHPNAVDAARAAECAHRQGKFAAMRELLFANQTRLSQADLLRYAALAGLAAVPFTACLGSDESYAAVERDWQDGLALGVKGTPTYFIGDQKIEGAPQSGQLQQAIAAALTDSTD